MKKLFAILLSMLLLCTMIPFATVSAAGEYYIELVADVEEVNAGEDVAVEVNLYGHEEVGLTGAQLELSFDPNVFELVTYYDEDEEMWMPPIEVGPKFSASSNKYILFSPIDEETGYMERCLVQFLRATATATQAVKTNLFYTATLHVKDDAPSGTYTIDLANFNHKNIVFYGNINHEYTWEPITITVNGTEPVVPPCEHQYDGDCDADCNLCGEIREAADHVYDTGYPCDDDCNVCGAVREVTHTYVYECDQYCNECGERTNPSATHSVLHVDAVPPVNCVEYGNVEYWYCEHCGVAWTDEARTQQTNLMRVRVVGECVSDSPVCKDGVCINCGLPCPAEADHTYDSDTDYYCNTCEECRLAIITQPKSIQVKNGATAKVSVEAVGEGLTYQWYIKNAGKTKYSKSSVTKATYSTTMSDSSRDRYVYCIVKDKDGNEIKSKTVVLRMAASITKEPATAAYAKKGAKVSVKITAKGDGLKYTWYIKNDGKTTYSKSSVTSATYSTTMSSTSKGRRVYCIVTDKYGKKVQSKTFLLREAVSIVTQPKTVTVKKNATAKVTVKASGDGLKYTWYVKNAGSSKYTKSSITKSTYSVKMTSKVNGRYLYCVVKDKYGKTVKTSTVRVKMK